MERTGKNRLSQRELNGYRQWLAELEEEMADTPGLSQQLDGDLTLYFSPECPIGRQVYTSFLRPIQEKSPPGHLTMVTAMCAEVKYPSAEASRI